MKKIILLTLVLGIYTIPASASDVDSDYSDLQDSLTRIYHSLEMENTDDGKTGLQQYNEDTPWIGTTQRVEPAESTHRFPFDDFGYDEE